MGLGVQPQQEHFAIYTLIYVWKQYFQLLNWHKIVTYIIILALFFLKTANLIINWLLSDATCHRAERTSSILIFKLSSDELGEICKCNLGYSKIPIFHFLWIWKSLETYTAPGQHFKMQMLNLWMSWENLRPNLNFTVENKMGNSHKRGSSHFKLNINGWDIPFPKILIIYQ